jgi:hypothetical protein
MAERVPSIGLYRRLHGACLRTTNFQQDCGLKLFCMPVSFIIVWCVLRMVM